MPEAVFVCLDSSDYMRNGDYFPNRMTVVKEAASLLLHAKMQKNPENTIGFLTLGGKACTVCESLTADADSVMASLTRVEAGGGCHFLSGLQIASLALSHRNNPRAEKRVIAFVSTPLVESEKSIEKLAKKLRKDEVAVDIVAIGAEGNNEILEKFIQTVNKNNNSHFLYIPEGKNVSDCVLSSSVVYGDDAPPPGASAGGFEFGVDPNLDPELAMVLRMSMEEERRRQEQAQSQSTDAGGATKKEEAAPAIEEVDEDAELAKALALSLQEQEDAPPKPANDSKPNQEVSDAVNDPEFLAELEAQVAKQLDADQKQHKDDKEKK